MAWSPSLAPLAVAYLQLPARSTAIPTSCAATPLAEAVMIPDELTIGLNWKGQKREWSFDSVFGASTPQDKVG